MKRKPTGQKYRNLFARGGVIYCQRRFGGKRIRFSRKTDDWGKAASVARLYEERKGIGRLPFATVEVPTFREFAKRDVRGPRGGARLSRPGAALPRQACDSERRSGFAGGRSSGATIGTGPGRYGSRRTARVEAR